MERIANALVILPALIALTIQLIPREVWERNYKNLDSSGGRTSIRSGIKGTISLVFREGRIMSTVDRIREKLIHSGGNAEINLLKGEGTFHVQLTQNGVLVDNLHSQPFLPWEVFEKAVELLAMEGGAAIKGDAMGSKLGEEKLPLNSIEGYIAKEVYNNKAGDSVFRRITPVVNILIWAGICRNQRGKLSLLKSEEIYYFSDQKEKLPLEQVEKLLSQTYWAKDRKEEVIEQSIKNSLCFGGYLEENDQLVAFARVITDYATAYYLCDVIVDENHRGQGIGKALVERVVNDPHLTGLRGILATRDAHGLYEKFGFHTDSTRFMGK